MNKNINFLFALLLADALFDALFLSAVLSPSAEKDEEETDKHPLIGRRYKVGDNSYIKDKETGLEGMGLYGREVIIVSDPYVETAGAFVEREHLFVDVFSTDSARKYRVLFSEDWLIDEE